MESDAPYITNLVNSIIGVSVLAMPFCMKKCGLILGLGLLIGMAWLTYISCNMLVTAAVVKRRRTYEYLAFYTIGPKGKFAVELCMIGLMLGTCIAFYVIIGDLATAILQEQLKIETIQLRTFVITFCAFCIALPLGLMKNISVLGFIGLISLGFYILFVCVMIANSISRGFLNFSWIYTIDLFNPSGIFQCLPIFSLAYACQCQLFLVYDSLEDASVIRMEKIVARSLKIVTFVYCMVAVLGYATYIDFVEGNVLKNFSPNFILDLIKLGFAVSVVVGFPLMIFPCRQSIHTLFFSQQPTDGVATKTYIEPFMFKAITLCIVLSTMMVALFIPNVETILGLTGATMGSFICFIFPGIIFTKASKEDAGVSKFVLSIGCILLVLCTYSNVVSTTQSKSTVLEKNVPPEVADIQKIHDIKKPVVSKPPIALVIEADHRHEPANPIEPVLPNKVEEKNQEIHKNIPIHAQESFENQKPLHQKDIILNKNEKIDDKKDVRIIYTDGNSKKDMQNPLDKDISENKPKISNSLQSDTKLKKDADETNSLNVQQEILNLPNIKGEKKVENIPESIDAEKLLNKIKQHQKQQHELLHAEEALIKALEKKQNVQKQEHPDKKLELTDNNAKNLVDPHKENSENKPIHGEEKATVTKKDFQQIDGVQQNKPNSVEPVNKQIIKDEDDKNKPLSENKNPKQSVVNKNDTNSNVNVAAVKRKTREIQETLKRNEDQNDVSFHMNVIL